MPTLWYVAWGNMDVPSIFGETLKALNSIRVPIGLELITEGWFFSVQRHWVEECAYILLMDLGMLSHRWAAHLHDAVVS